MIALMICGYMIGNVYLIMIPLANSMATVFGTFMLLLIATINLNIGHPVPKIVLGAGGALSFLNTMGFLGRFKEEVQKDSTFDVSSDYRAQAVMNALTEAARSFPLMEALITSMSLCA